jgi:hypothetical protein
MTPEVRVTDDDELTSDDLDEMRRLFGGEYRELHGPWSPDLPYGYATPPR